MASVGRTHDRRAVANDDRPAYFAQLCDIANVSTVERPSASAWGLPARALSEDGVDALVGGVFFVVEGADVGGDECFDAVSESSRCLGEGHPGA